MCLFHDNILFLGLALLSSNYIGTVDQYEANHHVCELDALGDGTCHSTYHNLDPICLQAFPSGGKSSIMYDCNLKKDL